jgi:beta-1,4-N-acetylglucosaminyltransferase
VGITFTEIWKKSKVLGEGNLILVIVGLMYGFENLVREMDEIAGSIEEEVVIQIGKTSYEPKNAKYFRFVSKNEIAELYDSARVVVCHAGVGSILTALEHNKPVIAVPRKKNSGEHIDDHQLEIARKLESEGNISVVYDVGELKKALANVSVRFSVKAETDKRLEKALKEYINELRK